MRVNRREFVRLGALGAATARNVGRAAAGPAADFELEEASIASLQEGMRTGRWTSQSIVTLYLERIESIDRSGPEINSIIELNPDALIQSPS